MANEKVEIKPGQSWRNKKMNMTAVIEGVSSNQVCFTFDGCSCALTKSEFRRKYVLEARDGD